MSWRAFPFLKLAFSCCNVLQEKPWKTNDSQGRAAAPCNKGATCPGCGRNSANDGCATKWAQDSVIDGIEIPILTFIFSRDIFRTMEHKLEQRDLRYKDVERALARVFDIADQDLPAFRARIRHLRNLGALNLPKVGSGTQITYKGSDVYFLLFALELEYIGCPPRIAAVYTRQIGEKLGALILKVVRSEEDLFFYVTTSWESLSAERVSFVERNEEGFNELEMRFRPAGDSLGKLDRIIGMGEKAKDGKISEKEFGRFMLDTLASFYLVPASARISDVVSNERRVTMFNLSASIRALSNAVGLDLTALFGTLDEDAYF